MSRNRLVLLGVAALAAVVAALLLVEYAREVRLEAQGGEPVAIAVAKTTIDRNAVITEEMVKAVAYPRRHADPRFITWNDRERLFGQRAATQIAAESAFHISDIGREAVGGEAGVGGRLAKGQRALAIPVDVTSSLAGQIKSSDHVDVVASTARGSGAVAVTRTILEDLLVIATDADGGAAGAARTTGGRGVTSVTLAVDVHQAELLLHAMRFSTMSLVLRSPSDTERQREARTVTFSDLFGPALPNPEAPVAPVVSPDKARRMAEQAGSHPPVLSR